VLETVKLHAIADFNKNVPSKAEEDTIQGC
jgi:hypothetical protein